MNRKPFAIRRSDSDTGAWQGPDCLGSLELRAYFFFLTVGPVDQ